MSEPRVSVVVVSYNGGDWLDRCLGALFGDARPVAPFEVVVVDNGSDEATRAVLERWSSQATVHYSEENLGFGRGCNLAATIAGGSRIVLLNPDHAQAVSRAGWTKRDIQLFLWQEARNPVDEVKDRSGWSARRSAAAVGDRIPVVNDPEEIIVVMAGGSGGHSMVAIPWGLARAVHREVSA